MNSLRMCVAASVLGVGALATGAQAQVLLDLFGATSSSGFGRSMAIVGDVNGDGRLDLAVGAPFDAAPLGSTVTSDAFPGSVRILSGLDGSVLASAAGSQASELFGWSVAAAGDLNADGVPDVIIGAPNYSAFRGRVVVLSGSGEVLYTIHGNSAGDRFGWSVASAGDLNGDGRADFAVGAWNDNDGLLGQGTVSIYSGASAGLLESWGGVKAGDHLGSSLAGPGDVDLDGVPDVAAGGELIDGAGNQVDVGGVMLRSMQPGTTLFTWVGGSEGDMFGHALAGPGDATGDGVPDVFVGAPGWDAFGGDSGQALLFSGASGQIALTVLPDSGGGTLGVSVAGAGDLDDDGRVDLAVGAPLTGLPFAAGAGRAMIFSSSNGTLLKSVDGGELLGGCGTAVVCGDIDADGFSDFVVGEPFDGGAPFGPGLVRIVSGDVWVNIGLGLSGGAGVPQFVALGAPTAGQDVSLQLLNAPAGAMAVLIIGFSELGQPFKGGTMVANPDWFSPLLAASLDGGLALGAAWPAGVPEGMTFWFQWWVSDPSAPLGWTATVGLKVDAQ